MEAKITLGIFLLLTLCVERLRDDALGHVNFKKC